MTFPPSALWVELLRLFHYVCPKEGFIFPRLGAEAPGSNSARASIHEFTTLTTLFTVGVDIHIKLLFSGGHVLYWQRKSVSKDFISTVPSSSGKRWKLYGQLTEQTQVSVAILNQEERTWTGTFKRQTREMCSYLPPSERLNTRSPGVHQRLLSCSQAFHSQESPSTDQ